MLFVPRVNRSATPGPVGDWFTQKFLAYQSAEKTRKSVDDFAAHVGVKRGTMNQWLNGSRRPRGAYVKIVADKLGAEIYDLLGLRRPEPEGQNTPLDVFRNLLTPEQRAEIEQLILRFADENARKRAQERGENAKVA